jgi:hypothetical protein
MYVVILSTYWGKSTDAGCFVEQVMKYVGRPPTCASPTNAAVGCTYYPPKIRCLVAATLIFHRMMGDYDVSLVNDSSTQPLPVLYIVTLHADYSFCSVSHPAFQIPS